MSGQTRVHATANESALSPCAHEEVREQLTMLVFLQLNPGSRSPTYAFHWRGIFAITRSVPCVVRHVRHATYTAIHDTEDPFKLNVGVPAVKAA